MAVMEPTGVASLGAFSPTDLSGLVLWLRADAIPGMTDGATVTSWPDQSGQGNDGTRHGTDPLPTWKAAVQNSLPGVRFSTATGCGFETALTLPAPCTLFTVFDCRNDVSGAYRVIQGKSANWMIGVELSAIAAFGDGTWISLTAQAAVINTFYAVSGVYTGAQSHLYVNGVDKTQDTASGSGPGGVCISAPTTAAINFQPAGGDVGEIIAYSRALSTGDRQAVEAYLKGRWNTP